MHSRIEFTALIRRRTVAKYIPLRRFYNVFLTIFFVRTNLSLNIWKKKEIQHRPKKYTCRIPQIFLFYLVSVSVTAQNRPFPQHTAYYKHIKPSQYSQETLDYHVKTFYDKWKSLYLRKGCLDDQYIVFFDNGNTLTVSEAMGYGMMIMPLIAGYDPNAKKYFDGMFRYYKAHPSGLTPHLMAWKQITGCVNAGGDDSASDGDIDIAFGLLLANEQWGSTGEINYLYYAKLILDDLVGKTADEGDINQDAHTVKLGDWVRSAEYMNGTRSSDFITDHFRVFACFSNDSMNWSDVVDKCYQLIANIQQNYSTTTGLLPDFIIDTDTAPKPAPANYLEGTLDGHYSYNACRDPWRLASDYLIFGDNRAFDAVMKINRWLSENAEGDVAKVYAGYYLNGNKAANWNDISFTAPFAVGAMLDTTNQDWLNKLYLNILYANTADAGYYGNTLKLLSMITISGNYWVPACGLNSGIPKNHLRNDNEFDVYWSTEKDVVIINFKNRLSYEKTELFIINIWGSLVMQQSCIERPITKINISSLPDGLYLLSLFTPNGEPLGTKKIIKLDGY